MGGGSVQRTWKDHRQDQQRIETLKRHSLALKLQKALNARRQVFRRGNKKMLTKKNLHFLSELQEICLAPSAMCFYNTSVSTKLLLEMTI